jgi:hypothetical protein
VSTFWQTVIPAALTALVAGRVAITRTGRLRKVIHQNIDLLGTLPADHPSRATVETHIEELVDRLVRREQRQFEPITPPGTSFGVNVTVAGFGLLGVAILAAEAIGVYHASPLEGRDLWEAMAFYGAVAVLCAIFAVKAHREQQR